MKRFRLLWVGVVCVVLFAALHFYGCAKMGGDKVRISSWGDLQENQILRGISLMTSKRKTRKSKLNSFASPSVNMSRNC